MYFAAHYLNDIISFAKSALNDDQLQLLEKQWASDGKEKTTSYEQVESLLKQVVTFTKNDFFGLQMGEAFMLMATAQVDSIMQRSHTVEEAFQNAVTFSRLISDSMDCELHKDQSTFSVRFYQNPDWAVKSDLAIRQNLDTALVCAQRSLHRLTNKEYHPLRLRLPYPKPSRIKEYYRIFNCPLLFGEPYAEIVFCRTTLSESVADADPQFLDLLKIFAREELRQLPEKNKLIYRVKKQLLENWNPDFPDVEEVAQGMHMSVRTLQRKLIEEKSGYREICNELKSALSVKYLRDSPYRINEIAHLLGYTEPSVFIRAFKRWKGTSPEQFRKQISS